MSEIKLELRDIDEAIAMASTEGYKLGVKNGKNSAIGEYSNQAHSRILYDLVDIMADLRSEEIKAHEDNIDEWLCVWKNEVCRRIWHSMCVVREEMEGVKE